MFDCCVGLEFYFWRDKKFYLDNDKLMFAIRNTTKHMEQDKKMLIDLYMHFCYQVSKTRDFSCSFNMVSSYPRYCCITNNKYRSRDYSKWKCHYSTTWKSKC